MIFNDLENKNRFDEFNSHPRYAFNFLIASELRLAGVSRSGQQRGSTLSNDTLFSSSRGKENKKKCLNLKKSTS